MKVDHYNRYDIFYFIVNDQFAEFVDHLKSVPDINHKDTNGMNLLHFACEYNRAEYARLLIQKGIEINCKDNYGNNPLWKAVFNSRGD